MRPPTEFRIKSVGNGDWIVYWWGGDGRNVARCFNRYEAAQIARALNDTGAAVRWYKRAQTALGLRDAERTVR